MATAFDAINVRCGVDEGMHCLKGRISQSARHLCYGPLKVSSEIALRKLNEQKDIFTIWENFVPGLFFQTAVSRERNEIL